MPVTEIWSEEMRNSLNAGGDVGNDRARDGATADIEEEAKRQGSYKPELLEMKEIQGAK